MDPLIKNEIFLRNMEALKEENRKLEEKYSTWYLDIFGYMGQIRSKIQDQECLLREKEEPIIS